MFVEVNRQRQLTAHALGEAPRMRGGLLHGDAGNRNERANIGRAHARVLAAVLHHVDELAGLPNRAERRLGDGGRCADEGDDGAVGRLARVDVEQLDALDGLDLVGDLFDNRRIAAFTEIRNTFDQLAHGKNGVSRRASFNSRPLRKVPGLARR